MFVLEIDCDEHESDRRQQLDVPVRREVLGGRRLCDRGRGQVNRARRAAKTTSP